MWTERIAEAVSTDIAGAVEHLDADNVDAFFAAQQENLRNYSDAMGHAAEALSEKHIHHSVVEWFREASADLMGTSESAAQMYQTHKDEHDPFSKE